MFSITINERGDSERRLEFDKSEVTIGRVRGNDVVLPKNNVSKRHAKLVVKDGKFIIIDSNSTNGTIVNGRKITAPQVVKETDRISVGDFVLTVRDEGEGTPKSPGPPAPPPAAAKSGPGLDSLRAGPGKATQGIDPVPPPPPVAPVPPKASTDDEATVEESDATSRETKPAIEAAQPPAEDTDDAADAFGTEETADAADEELAAVAARRATVGTDPAPSNNAAADFEFTTGGLSPLDDSHAEGSTVALRGFREDTRSKPPSNIERTTLGEGRSVSAVSADFAQAQRKIVSHFLSAIDVDELPMVYPPRQEDIDAFRDLVQEAIRSSDEETLPTGPELELLEDIVVYELVGLGALELYLDDPSIHEIFVNAHDAVFIRDAARLRPAPITFGATASLAVTAMRLTISASLSDPIGGSMRLSGGARLELILPPASPDGPVISIRKAATRLASLEQLEERGVVSAEVRHFLQTAVSHGQNVVISAQDRHDATLVANAVVNSLGDDLRVVAIEEVPSLQLDSPSNVRLEYTPGVFPSSIRRGLAMQPDVFVLDPLPADHFDEVLFGTNPSTWSIVTTLSARSASACLAQLEVLALEGRSSDALAVRRQLAQRVDFIVHLSRGPEGVVRVNEVTEVTGADANGLSTTDVFRAKHGPGGLELAPTGHVPAFFADLRETGADINDTVFEL